MTTIPIDPNELSDKRALVTGGTKGMGETIVNRLRQAGATVITTARSKPDELKSPATQLQRKRLAKTLLHKTKISFSERVVHSTFEKQY